MTAYRDMDDISDQLFQTLRKSSLRADGCGNIYMLNEMLREGAGLEG